MIARRGFLAGCLAVVASPMLRFLPREKPITWFLEHPGNPDSPLIEIRQFSRRVEVWCDGAQWTQREDDSSPWMVFEGNSQNWYGAIRLRKREDGFDVDWYALSDHPLRGRVMNFNDGSPIPRLSPKSPQEIIAEIDRLAKEKQQDFFDHVFDVGGRQGVSSAS